MQNPIFGDDMCARPALWGFFVAFSFFLGGGAGAVGRRQVIVMTLGLKDVAAVISSPWQFVSYTSRLPLLDASDDLWISIDE
jgi:hypothetical protein